MNKIEELLQKLMLETYRINRDTKHTIFWEFHGHTNQVDLRIYKNGWNENANIDCSKTVYLCYTQQEALEGLQQMLDILKNLK